MISLDKEQLYLLELIKASLFGNAPEIPEDANWEKIFEAAKTQCIVPLLASCVPAEHREHWNAIVYQSKAHYMQMLYEQNALIKLFNDSYIPFVILKGTAAAIYYPIPTMRAFGDIDIYVSKKFWKSSLDLLEGNGYRFISDNIREYEFEKNGIVLELHSKFSSRNYTDIEHIIINGLNNSVNYKFNNSVFPGLPVYENGLVLLGHIMQHLKTSGIGLRQIIDWMMFVHKTLDDSTWNSKFRAYAIEAGLEKLAITVTYMCKKWFGLPDSITWCDSANDEVADQLLIRILDDGNFGLDRAPIESVKQSIKEEGIFKYFHRVGLENWPLAQRHVFFRPFAWIYQLCRYIIKGIAGLFTGRKLFMQGKNNMSIGELLKRLE